MAKTQNTAQPTEQELYEQMMANLSPEERAALDKITGQDRLKGGKKTPVVRISYKETDDTDANGKSVKKGNFVLGQKTSYTKEGVEVIEEIGTDLGSELDVTILAFGTQYSFYSTQKGQSCSSQVIRERNEKPIGSTLKRVCSDGTCPRRQEGLDKKDKCTNQYVLFLKLPAGTKMPDGTDCPVAMFYVKGSSYMACKDYLSGKGETSLRGVNSLMCRTLLSSVKQKQGSVVYFDVAFKRGPMDPIGFKENFQLASEVTKELDEFKEQNARALPAPEEDSTYSPAELVTGNAGESARYVNGNDDNIVW